MFYDIGPSPAVDSPSLCAFAHILCRLMHTYAVVVHGGFAYEGVAVWWMAGGAQPIQDTQIAIPLKIYCDSSMDHYFQNKTATTQTPTANIQ